MYQISVIMGLYNCESTLNEALESLYNQTYRKFKLIMCEDGSSDCTYEVARRFAESYDNVILLRNEKNMGLNYTLNRCLEYVDTEYVARMDGDDVSLPTRFEKQIAFLDNHPEYAVVSSPMIYFDETGVFKEGKAIEFPDKYDFIKGTPFCHAPCMVRADVMKAVGGYTDDKRILRVEDYHLWFKVYAAGYKGANLQEALYKMRDDRNAYRRRTLSSRFNEAYVKSVGYRMLRLPFYYQVFALRPILVGLLPKKIYMLLHR